MSLLRGGKTDPSADAAWLTGKSSSSAAAVALIARYLSRVRQHRYNGAVLGGGLALLHSVTYEQNISIGIGSGSPLGDLLFGSLAGLLVGSVLAETWRIRRRRRVRQAEISVRSPEAEAKSLRVPVAVLTIFTVLLALASRRAWPTGMAAASLLLLVVHRLVLRAVAERGRPALPEDLRDADDAIRAFAGRRLGIETFATAMLLAGWQFASVDLPVPRPLGVASLVGSVVATIVLVHRSRPWPPRGSRRAPLPTAA
ncbi:MAG: hypothetical protein ACT4OS_02495 [Acidimicrobiales bacterium]